MWVLFFLSSLPVTQVLVYSWLMIHRWGRKTVSSSVQSHCPAAWFDPSKIILEMKHRHETLCVICAPFRKSWPAADMGVNSGKVLWCLNLESRSQWFMSLRCECVCVCYEPACIYVCECVCVCVNKVCALLLNQPSISCIQHLQPPLTLKPPQSSLKHRHWHWLVICYYVTTAISGLKEPGTFFPQ